jgi:hypothetical protein
MSEIIQFSFCSAGRKVKGVASLAQTCSSKKLLAGNRRFEKDWFMVTYVGEMHGSELEEEWTGER